MSLLDGGEVIDRRSILRADELTMTDVFESNGYATGIFGKWYLGDNYPLCRAIVVFKRPSFTAVGLASHPKKTATFQEASS